MYHAKETRQIQQTNARIKKAIREYHDEIKLEAKRRWLLETEAQTGLNANVSSARVCYHLSWLTNGQNLAVRYAFDPETMLQRPVRPSSSLLLVADSGCCTRITAPLTASLILPPRPIPVVS
jgi:hypothetical protein